MNIAMRKLALLEKNLIAQEEACKIDGYCTIPENSELRQKITFLMDKVRQL